MTRRKLVILLYRVVVDGTEHGYRPFEVRDILTRSRGVVPLFLVFETALVVLAVLLGNAGLQVFQIAVYLLQGQREHTLLLGQLLLFLVRVQSFDVELYNALVYVFLFGADFVDLSVEVLDDLLLLFG